MKINRTPSQYGDLIDTGQAWIADAVAQQEEHLRRIRSCTSSKYPHHATALLDHAWDRFSPAPGADWYEACWRCGVSRTDEDFQRKIRVR